MKSKKEQLIDAGYSEDVFMPVEADDAFIGIAVTDWHHGKTVFDKKKLDEIGYNMPDDANAIIVNKLSDMADFDTKEYVTFAPDGLDAAIYGITEEGQVVYSLDELTEKMMEVENWSYEEASEWISFNTLRDYSYRDKGPVVFCNADYIFE